MLYASKECGCTKEVGMSKSRERHVCDCGNSLHYVNSLRPVSEKRERELANEGKPRPRSTLKRGKGFEASPAQRAKVKGAVCVGCGREGTEDGRVTIDPAHVWPQGKGGCDHPDCVWGLCRGPDYSCHRLFDEGKLDLLAKVSTRPEAFAIELAHPIREHGVTLVELVRRLAGNAKELTWVDRESPVREVV